MTITILKTLPRVAGTRRKLEVQCHCGKVFVTLHNSVMTGATKSCGCSRHAGNRKPYKCTHGLTKHELYQTWQDMMKRCYNEDHPMYRYYGNRGITVCLEWHDVVKFVEGIEGTIGPRPAGKTLDRENNNRGYSPDNVKWSTRTEQARNQRSNVMITIDGVTKCASEWAEESGINRRTIIDRYRLQGIRGQQLLTPTRKKN